MDSMTDQERITELCKVVRELSGIVERVNDYLDAKISSAQDRIGRLEAENAELRRRIGLPEQ